MRSRLVARYSMLASINISVRVNTMSINLLCRVWPSDNVPAHLPAPRSKTNSAKCFRRHRRGWVIVTRDSKQHPPSCLPTRAKPPSRCSRLDTFSTHAVISYDLIMLQFASKYNHCNTHMHQWEQASNYHTSVSLYFADHFCTSPVCVTITQLDNPTKTFTRPSEFRWQVVTDSEWQAIIATSLYLLDFFAWKNAVSAQELRTHYEHPLSAASTHSWSATTDCAGSDEIFQPHHWRSF